MIKRQNPLSDEEVKYFKTAKKAGGKKKICLNKDMVAGIDITGNGAMFVGSARGNLEYFELGITLDPRSKVAVIDKSNFRKAFNSRRIHLIKQAALIVFPTHPRMSSYQLHEGGLRYGAVMAALEFCEIPYTLVSAKRIHQYFGAMTDPIHHEDYEKRFYRYAKEEERRNLILWRGGTPIVERVRAYFLAIYAIHRLEMRLQRSILGEGGARLRKI